MVSLSAAGFISHVLPKDRSYCLVSLSFNNSSSLLVGFWKWWCNPELHNNENCLGILVQHFLV